MARPDRQTRRAGFTLIEALVAFAVVLAFTAAIAPFLFQARRIVGGSGERVAAYALLRSLLDSPIDRTLRLPSAREGQTDVGLRWRVVMEPLALDVLGAMRAELVRQSGNSNPVPFAWTLVRVTATVSWSPVHAVSAETVRLGAPR